MGVEIATHTHQETYKLNDEKINPKKEDGNSPISIIIHKINCHPIQTVRNRTKTTSRNSGHQNK